MITQATSQQISTKPLDSDRQASHALCGVPGERLYTADQLAGMFNVSTKTISRWRKRGLEGTRVERDGRAHLVFPKSAVQTFAGEHKDLVRRGARFSHMTADEREILIRRARQMVDQGQHPTKVIKQLADETRRNPVTIRATIKRFDRQHPATRILGDKATLNDAAKEAIYRERCRGVSVATLATEFGKSPAYIERVDLQMRARRLQQLPMEYVPSPAFDKPGAEDEILSPLPTAEHTPRVPRRPAGLPAYLASLYETCLLTRQQELHLFRKYNYLKFRAARLRERLNAGRLQKRLVKEIEEVYDRAVATKKRLIQANLRLVVSIAKRYVGKNDDLFELISDGNLSLMRAIEKFDYTLGNKFSTYASWAIKNNFARDRVQQLRRCDRFRNGHDDVLVAEPENRSDVYEMESDQQRYAAQVGRILQRLDDRERLIIARRFGLTRGEEPQTLQNVGDQLGVSKERIRQIEARAMDKLREAVGHEKIDGID